MSWFSLFGRRERRYPADLLGCWELVKADAPDSELGSEIDFKSDGRMQYSIPTPETWQIFKLTWWVEGTSIVTDQPSAPRVERSEFWFEDHDTLLLKRLESGRSWFRRSQKRAPAV